MITLDSTSIFNQPWFYVLMLLVIFGAIVILVILAKKYLKPFQSDDKPKSEKEIAEEEVNRLVRPVEDEETARQMEAASKEIEQNSKKTARPTEAEATQEEIKRTTRPVEDQETRKQMEAYATSHPEEAEAAKKKSLDSEKK
jgi:hypothetical protein